MSSLPVPCRRRLLLTPSFPRSAPHRSAPHRTQPRSSAPLRRYTVTPETCHLRAGESITLQVGVIITSRTRLQHFHKRTMGMRERGEERPVFAALCVEYGDDGVTKLKQFKQSFKSFFTFDIDRDWNLPELHKEEEEDDGRGGGGWHAGMGAKAGTGSGFLAQAFDENAAYDGGSGGGDYGGTVWDLKNKSAGGGGSGLEVDVGELDIGGGGGGRRGRGWGSE